MHRHGYQGRKFGRERDQRRALLKSLADSLIKYESIETTLPKAKELVPYAERLITKAKKADLHSRRQIIADLQTLESAHKLVDAIVPKLSARSSGHLRIDRTVLRRGDHAQLARVSFVDDLTKVVSPTKEVKSVPAKPVSPTKSARTAPKSSAKATLKKSEKK